MSVIVSDLLTLPCLRQAKLLAGQGGLSNIVTSISVLEYADPGITSDRFFSSNRWSGGELVISAFANIRNDLDAQCASIRTMSDVGEVGLVLYYVGILLPAVHPRLITLCDELDFALILMPEHRTDLRYSEVICEAMEAIFRDQQASVSLVTDILERVSSLPEHQRTVDTVLRMVSNILRATVTLADAEERLLGQAAWPSNQTPVLQELIRLLAQAEDCQSIILPTGEYACRCAVSTAGDRPMTLYLLRATEPPAPEYIRQAVEVVRLATSIWSSTHGAVLVSELVRAILRDEPIKMRRLANIFRVDVASIHSMWVLRGAGETFQREALAQVRELLSCHCAIVVADCYEGDVVAFMDWPSGLEMASLAQSLCDQLSALGLPATLTMGHSLASTQHVRRAFLLHADALESACRIWPGRTCYTMQEMEFAQNCHRLLEAGEAATADRMAVFFPLVDGGGELRHTLCTYLLDAGGSHARCAALLFLHKNTVKYRMGRIESRLGHAIGKQPEQFALYQAAALSRLLSEASFARKEQDSSLRSE